MNSFYIIRSNLEYLLGIKAQRRLCYPDIQNCNFLDYEYVILFNFYVFNILFNF